MVFRTVEKIQCLNHAGEKSEEVPVVFRNPLPFR